MVRSLRILLAAFSIVSLASCGAGVDDDVTRIAFIGSADDLSDNGVRLSPAGQHLRAATAEGLVSLNETGEVIPALAERWIVTDDGLSYIFRLRNSDWPDGTALTGENALESIRRNIRLLQGTSLGLDLGIISDMRAMTGRVIEIRLKNPMPQFLQLLAQPELGLRRNGAGNGPMVSKAIEQGVELQVLPPENRGLAAREDWQDQIRRIRLVSLPAADATAAFDAGEADAVFNGRLPSLPLADVGPLSRGTVRLDAAIGLFGLRVKNVRGLLSEVRNREAIAMAIERETLLQPFNIGGWLPTTRLAPPDLPDSAPDPAETGDSVERWADRSFDDRQNDARRRILEWKAASGSSNAELKIWLPPEPGSDLLFTELAEDMAGIGVILQRVERVANADLELVDRLARYADIRWFLNQFDCSLRNGPCSSEAGVYVREALAEADPASRSQLLADAEQALLASNIYIPIGAPVRWSLIRGGVDGFAENRLGLHPLFHMALRPI